MKNKLNSFLFLFLVGGMYVVFSQKKTCKVLKEDIQKVYVGKCKKGLAHGKGIATGISKYEGNFKKGLPSGKGIFTFSSGWVYDGSWENGMMDGKGKLYFKVNGVDSIRVGFWKEGEYIGKKAISDYKIILNSGVDRYSFIRLRPGNNSNLNRISIKFRQNGGNNSAISNVRIFGSSGNEKLDLRKSVGYEDISFPFTCKLNYDTSNKLKTMIYSVIFEFVVNVPGDWELTLNN